jgi:hypothetical protein
MHKVRGNQKSTKVSKRTSNLSLIPTNLIAIPTFFFVNWSIFTTPIVGDDLINPFDLYRQTNGSVIEVIKYSLDWGLYNHIAPVGMLAGGLWNYSWIASQDFTGISHETFYILTKAFIYTLFILTLQKLIRRLLPKDFSKKGSVEIISVLSISALIQVHGLWSNDPVTNYPLTGMLSTIIGIWCIINFIDLIECYTKRKFLITFLNLVIACFWYEMNLGLLVALPVYYAIKLRKLNTQRSRISFRIGSLITMIGTPLFIFLTFRIMNLDAASKYDGTTIKLGLDAVQTWLLLNLSWIPFANFYTADHLNIPLNFKLQTVYFIQVAVLITTTFLLMKILKSKANFVFVKKTEKSILLHKTIPLALYALSATASHALTPKYQSEIKVLGQVYMSYSVVLMTACALLSVYILLSKSALWVLCAIAIGNLAINTTISQTFNLSMIKNTILIESFNSGNSRERCEALEQWKSINWPDYYRVGMESGLNYSFKSIRNSNFCSD